MLRFVTAWVAVLLASAAHAQDIPLYPDPSRTPGTLNPDLTQAVVRHSAFSTKAFRRPSKSERKCVLSRYGTPSYAFTYDHLVPLELGGADRCDNLWPQARAEARRKDQLENALQRQVCACGRLTLGQAQELIRRDWRSAWATYVTPKGAPFCAINEAKPSS